MSILSRIALYPAERLDVPDARMIDAAAINDWRYFLQGVISNGSIILSGFEVTNYGNIFTGIGAGVNLKQSNVVVVHSEATTQAAGFYVSSGSEADFSLSLSPSSTNFVEVDFTNVSGVSDVRVFWDSGTKSEYKDTVDTVINLALNITSNVSSFTDGKIPLYKITTNSSGVVTALTDCRPLLYRLGKGGVSPDPDNTFTFPSLPDAAHAQFETPTTATSYSSSNSPFYGGDKGIKTLKNWMDAIMSSIKKNKAVPYWYMNALSQSEIYQNAALTLLIGGTWVHNSGTAGFLTLNSGTTIYRLGKSNNCGLTSFTSLDLRTNVCLFILLSATDTALNYRMGQNGSTPVIPKNVSAVTSNSITVATSGNYVTTPGATAAALLIRGQVFSYTAYDETTGAFTGVTPDPSGLVQVGDTVYQESSGVNGYYHYGGASQVPGMTGIVSEGAERAMWLVFFDGTSMHTPTSILSSGEQITVGNNTSQQILTYIGSSGDSDALPIYGVSSISDGTDLTTAISDAFKIIETPIYDEVTTPSSMTSGSVITLPPNSRNSFATQTYTLGSGQLEVYSDGLLLQKGSDYNETTNRTITLLKDLSFDTTIRFRIACIGGAGINPVVTSLQQAYSYGKTISISSGSPIIISGPSETLLKVQGKTEIDGLLTSPLGITFTGQSTSPIPSGSGGFWVNTSGDSQYTGSDGTTIQVSSILKSISGEQAKFTRTFQNTSGSTIAAGSAVYISGTGQIALASCSSSTNYRFLGITPSSIANNASGSVIYQGVVPGIFTGQGLTSGSYVWLSATPGALSTAAPTSPGYYLVVVGLVDGNDLILQPHFQGHL